MTSPEPPEDAGNAVQESVVFISYRTAVSRDAARRLERELRDHLGDKVFLDRKKLKDGGRWPAQLEDALWSERLRAVVCIIDPDFWTRPGEGGQPRLWEPGDWVFRELETAHTRSADPEQNFTLFLAPQSPASRPPREADYEGAPEHVQRLLGSLADVQMSSERYAIDGNDRNLEEFTQLVVDEISDLNVKSFKQIETWEHVRGLGDRDRRSLKSSLENQIARGAVSVRSAALVAAIEVLEREYDAAIDRLRRLIDPDRFFACRWAPREARWAPREARGSEEEEADSDSRYWRAFAGLALARAELRDQPPRRLQSVGLGRELALGVLMSSLKELEGMDADRAVATRSELALTLARIRDGFFGARGITMAPSVGEVARALDQELTRLAPEDLVPEVFPPPEEPLDELDFQPRIDLPGRGAQAEDETERKKGRWRVWQRHQ